MLYCVVPVMLHCAANVILYCVVNVMLRVVLRCDFCRGSSHSYFGVLPHLRAQNTRLYTLFKKIRKHRYSTVNQTG